MAFSISGRASGLSANFRQFFEQFAKIGGVISDLEKTYVKGCELIEL
jgi:hypothetical protein